MSVTDDSFQAFLASRPAVGQAYVSGDSEPLAAIFAAREPATFFGPSPSCTGVRTAPGS